MWPASRVIVVAIGVAAVAVCASYVLLWMWVVLRAVVVAFGAVVVAAVGASYGFFVDVSGSRRRCHGCWCRCCCCLCKL